MQVHERVLTHAHACHSMAGSLFWCLTARSYPDYDGFKVLLQQPAAQIPAKGISRPSAVRTMPPQAKPGVVKRSTQQPISSQQPSDIGSRSQEPSDGEPKSHVAGEGPAVGSDSEEARVQQQQQSGRMAQEVGSSGQGLRRVSTATEDNCSAAAAMFEAGGAQSVENTLLLDAATVSQIVQHARLMKQLNGQETQRDCLVM
ncbi:hypothetical protein COCOBI_02-2930 [Coccomyxa sp. Obi]|nr:hypothetical protein COCOBI_02-2930 [Coccomyxa sp. Obi]